MIIFFKIKILLFKNRDSKIYKDVIDQKYSTNWDMLLPAPYSFAWYGMYLIRTLIAHLHSGLAVDSVSRPNQHSI